jgi:hypothetical protein
MESGLRAGAFPSKVMVPVIDAARRAAPGDTAAATTPATRQNVIAVLRILISFIKV